MPFFNEKGALILKCPPHVASYAPGRMSSTRLVYCMYTKIFRTESIHIALNLPVYYLKLYYFFQFHKIAGVDCELNDAIKLMASTAKRVNASTNKQSFWNRLDFEIRLNLEKQDKPVRF